MDWIITAVPSMATAGWVYHGCYFPSANQSDAIFHPPWSDRK